MANHGSDDTQQGLYGKFAISRLDGSSEPGGRHHGCRYFTLDLDHDPHAMAALTAYANSCRDTHPLLSADLRAMVDAADQVVVAEG